MKVLHVITCIADSGGAEKLMEDLLPGLKREGVDVSCLVFNGFDSNNRQTLENAGVKVYELSHNTHYYHPMRLIKLIPYLRRYDIVHVHNTPAVVFTALASILSFGDSQLVETVHSTEARLRHIKGLRIFDKWIQNRYKTIICCSSMAASCLKEYIPNHPHIVTINNGVNLSKFVYALPNEDIHGSGMKSIVMVAWFRKEKQHKTLIKSLLFLSKQFHVFLVGDGETKNDCIQYAEELGVKERVHFLGLRTDVPSILKAADYIVLASHYEGLSLSSVEGMAVGKPFIASDVPGLREVVGGAGLLFQEENSEELAAKILELDKNPTLYHEVADRCYHRAMQYDISSMIKGYKDVYDQLMGAERI